MEDHKLNYLKQEFVTREGSIHCISLEKGYEEYEKFIDMSLHTMLAFNNEIPEDEDTKSIQYLGIRFVNSVFSMKQLLLNGYYQSAFMLLRDLIETGFLMEYFLHYPSKIGGWRNDSANSSWEFSPKNIRGKLDKKEMRDSLYKIYSEIAIHPRWEGIKLVSKDGVMQPVPEFIPSYLILGLENLAKLVPYYCRIYIYFIKSDDPEVQDLKNEFNIYYDMKQKEGYFQLFRVFQKNVNI
ncbi:hypothetical protein [Paenibacillus polymyxa]|uniref:hypothetical protein n=1 Tax=Paenibacillus polymyxa TaxID=1406 RepID=UPI0004DF5C96|nr:hypothetical protein [Paenibacillus polymyxa]